MSARLPERAGFTLIEMLVALAVFGLAAMALIKLTVESTRHAAVIERQAIATILAERLATEVALGRVPTSQGQTELAGQIWTWTIIPVVRRQGLQIHDVRVYVGGDLASRRIAHRAEALS